MLLHQIGGFALAIAAMALFGVYMVPRRRTGMSHQAFTLWMGVGIFFGTTLAGMIFSGIPRVTSVQYAVIFGCGIIWGTGTLGYTRAVQIIGLSRSTPVKNLSAVFGTILGIIILHEFSLANGPALALVVFGSLAVTISATLLGGLDAPDDLDTPKLTSRAKLYGFACALWAAIGFSIHPIPMKIYYAQGVTPAEFLFIMGQGCFLVMVIPILFNRPISPAKPITWHDKRLAMLSGLMWTVGSFCANTAVKLIGVAVTWPLTKTTLIAALYGAFILKEIDMAKHRRDFALGIALSVLGVLLLALATARG